jgi:Ca2+-binding RTX toxin-like protein
MSIFFNTLGSVMRRGTDQNDVFYAFTDKHWVTRPDAVPSSLSWTTSVKNADDTFFQFNGAGFGISTDLIRGSSGVDSIYGTATNDFLVYNNGDIANGLGAFRSIESFSLGDGEDFLDLSAHGTGGVAYDLPVTIDASKGSDTVIGGAASDTILGGKDHDLLMGNAGSDSLIGGGGNDRLYGSDMMQGDAASSDTLFGEDGNDTLVGSAGRDLLIGGAGADQLRGGGGNDRLYGSDGLLGDAASRDTLYGDDGNDTLVGSAGGDVLFGEAGNDRLLGGDGDDYIEGGFGNDETRYVYNNAALPGVDTVIFDQSLDRIVFEGLGITHYAPGGAPGTIFAQDVALTVLDYEGMPHVLSLVRLDAVTAAGEHFTIETVGFAANFDTGDFVFQ